MALNMQAMHVIEIRELVYSQLMRLPDTRKILTFFLTLDSH
jgi:hypothetical protein